MKGASDVSAEEAKYNAKWAQFIDKNPLNQPKTWQYWRDDVRPKSQFNKKFISRFSKGVKAQQAAKALVRSGIPYDHRGEVWWACSGGAELMATSKQSYADYLTLAGNATDNPAADTILKDLHRTFIYKEMQHRSGDPPDATTPMFDDAIVPLKNILLAYSLRNPRVGYCQSMNFLCAMLLLHLDEEQAFWVLASLVERLLLNDYYAPTMIGSRVDQLTFQSCLAWKLPRIFAHLRAMDVILEPILCPWFLCMFLHVLSLDTVQRIWDCFFFEGNVILFRMGLAICKLLETEIMQSDDIGSLFMLLKKPFENECTDELINTLICAAFDKSWLGSIPRSALDNFRGQHLSTLREMDIETQSRKAGGVNSVFNCGKDNKEEYEEKKLKSAVIYSGVERSLACVLQSSDSFRGKIEERKSGLTTNNDADVVDDDADDDVTIPLDILTTDIKDEGEDDDEGTDCHTASPVTISTIAYKPPPNRRTSVAMMSMLMQES